ncbi:MAG: PD-(D/E)XK nuclease family protein [Candidatus Nanopelagicales bacterium]|nr:PD-(D/E)XK nuclease family protein [Candidatus Nanopelagicales bacterium]
MAERTFDPATHTYRVDGVRLPSVTQIMRATGIIDDRWFDAWSRDRGSAVHLACELADHGTLDEASVDPRIRGYVTAWERFLSETRATVAEIEFRHSSAALGYAGTIDRVLSLHGDRPAIVDLKTGAPGRAAGIQTAAYADLYRDATGDIVLTRFAVRLFSAGKYSVVEGRTSDHDDWNEALWAYRERGKHGRD